MLEKFKSSVRTTLQLVNVLGSKQIGVGVLGCGNISDRHVAGYLACEEVKIVATCDLNSGRAKEKADLFIMDADLTHTTPRDIARAIQRANVKKVVLTHIHAENSLFARHDGYVSQTGYDELIAEIKRESNKEVIIAEDLASITV